MSWNAKNANSIPQQSKVTSRMVRDPISLEPDMRVNRHQALLLVQRMVCLNQTRVSSTNCSVKKACLSLVKEASQLPNSVKGIMGFKIRRIALQSCKVSLVFVIGILACRRSSLSIIRCFRRGNSSFRHSLPNSSMQRQEKRMCPLSCCRGRKLVNYRLGISSRPRHQCNSWLNQAQLFQLLMLKL